MISWDNYSGWLQVIFLFGAEDEEKRLKDILSVFLIILEFRSFWFYLRLKKVCLARPSACEKLFFFNCDLWLEKWGLLPEHPPRDCHHPYDDRRHHGDIKHDLKTSHKNGHTLRETNRASELTTTAGFIAAAALFVLEQPHNLHLNIKEFQKFSQLVSYKKPTTVILRARRKVTPAPPTTC